jgi:hypothetical protein
MLSPGTESFASGILRCARKGFRQKKMGRGNDTSKAFESPPFWKRRLEARTITSFEIKDNQRSIWQ